MERDDEVGEMRPATLTLVNGEAVPLHNFMEGMPDKVLEQVAEQMKMTLDVVYGEMRIRGIMKDEE